MCEDVGNRQMKGSALQQTEIQRPLINIMNEDEKTSQYPALVSTIDRDLLFDEAKRLDEIN
jgi:hypothetical protein